METKSDTGVGCSLKWMKLSIFLLGSGKNPAPARTDSTGGELHDNFSFKRLSRALPAGLAGRAFLRTMHKGIDSPTECH